MLLQGGHQVETEILEEERPFLRPFRSTLPWPLVALSLTVGGVAAYYYYELYRMLADAPVISMAAPTPLELRAVPPTLETPHPAPQAPLPASDPRP
jgi:hypothetical protein